jgi:ribA/ribD-fused uncharacterized protein
LKKKNVRSTINASKDPRPSSAGTEVQFYRANEKPYGPFSNLHRRSIVLDGRVYPTAEHAYQAGKARKEEVREWILSAPTPGLVAMAAHGLYTWDIVSDWSRIKYDRMRRVLRAKFTQHDDLRQLLLSTGDARIVEVGSIANAVNYTWGEVNGKGKNMLGVLLMELRAQLAAAESPAPSKAKTTIRQNGSYGRGNRLPTAALKQAAAATTA